MCVCVCMMVHYRVHNSRPFDHTLSHISSVHALMCCFFNIPFNSIIYLCHQPGLFPSVFPTTILYVFPFSPIRATCTAHLTLLYVFTLTIPDKQYNHGTPHSAIFSSVLSLAPSQHPALQYHHRLQVCKCTVHSAYSCTSTSHVLCFFLALQSPQWAMTSSFTRFLDYTQRRTTVGRTPLDE